MKGEKICTRAVRSLAESAKRKVELLNEKKAIAVFLRPDANVLPGTTEFYAAIRNKYLAQALKRPRNTVEEIESVHV